MSRLPGQSWLVPDLLLKLYQHGRISLRSILCRYEAGAEAGLLSNGREATPDYRRSKKLYQEAAAVYPAGAYPANLSCEILAYATVRACRHSHGRWLVSALLPLQGPHCSPGHDDPFSGMPGWPALRPVHGAC